MTAYGEQLRQQIEKRGTSLRALARTTHYDVGYLSKVMNGHKRPSRELASALDSALNAAGDLTALAPPQIPHTRHPAPRSEDGDHTNRRDALKIGLVGSIGPDALHRALSEAASDALEFTRLSGVSTVGAGTLDHLETVIEGLAHTYHTQHPAQQFATAFPYRRRVGSLLQDRHTLKEGRELYVAAAQLSESLAWAAHDLGESRTGEAFAIDAFHHADQASHGELAACAMDALASIAMYSDRPSRALQAAQRGVTLVPAGHPLAVRLRAQVARAHAALGHRDACEVAFRDASELYERLPAQVLSRGGWDVRMTATFAMTGFPASSYLRLGEFEKAKKHALAAVAAHESNAGQGHSPNRESIARIDLAIALAQLGSPDEASALGQQALAVSTRSSNSVYSRARELHAALTEHYPNLTHTHTFQAAYAASVIPT